MTQPQTNVPSGTHPSVFFSRRPKRPLLRAAEVLLGELEAAALFGEGQARAAAVSCRTLCRQLCYDLSGQGDQGRAWLEGQLTRADGPEISDPALRLQLQLDPLAGERVQAFIILLLARTTSMPGERPTEDALRLSDEQDALNRLERDWPDELFSREDRLRQEAEAEDRSEAKDEQLAEAELNGRS